MSDDRVRDEIREEVAQVYVPGGSLRETTRSIRRSLKLLTPAARAKYWLVVAAQISLGLLDLIGVLLVGLVGALSVTVLQGSEQLPTYLQVVSEEVPWLDRPPATLALWTALLAASFFIVKSVLSVLLVRRILGFLARRQAELSSHLTAQVLAQPLTFFQSRTSQTFAYALLDGTGQAVILLLGAVSVGAADAALLLLIGVPLLILNPVLTVCAAVFFVGIGFVMQRVLGNRAGRSGFESARLGVEGTEIVQSAIRSYREIAVSHRQHYYWEAISTLVTRRSTVQAETDFLLQVPKFVFEAALVVGAVALAASQLIDSSPAAAIGTMALFLAAGARVMPSLLRLQVAVINVRNAGARALPTYELHDALTGGVSIEPAGSLAGFLANCREEHPGFEPTIHARSLTFSYPGAESAAVRDVSFTVAPGTSLALVGGTGAGKSTIADLLLGLLEPSAGSVTVGGLSPASAAARWPGAIAYVPQVVGLMRGTVRDNVAMGLPSEAVDDTLVWGALERAALADFISEQPLGLDANIGESGVRLSGGQRQRLGIARALYTRPRLLVLDEATSALDAETEAAITEALHELRGSITTVTVAHRLATVRDADVVLYLDGGAVVAIGAFDEVRRAVPAFDRQASLMGL